MCILATGPVLLDQTEMAIQVGVCAYRIHSDEWGGSRFRRSGLGPSSARKSCLKRRTGSSMPLETVALGRNRRGRVLDGKENEQNEVMVLCV